MFAATLARAKALGSRVFRPGSLPAAKFAGVLSSRHAMFPIGDDNPTRTFPFVNYLLLGANIVVFVLQFLIASRGGEVWLTFGYGLVPTRFFNDPPGEAFTIFSSMFMHGSLAHVGGNMLYLYIFGDNVEDAMGHVRYLLFYGFCGIVAALVQVSVAPSSTVPMVGASGAIAGVLGGYLVLYPRAPVTVLSIPILWLWTGPLLVLPAWLMIGIWFVPNLLSAFLQIGQAAQGGVAFFAHVGGFIAGMLLVRLAIRGRRRTDPGRWKGWRSPPEWSQRAPRPW
jgi:membrane associated rhomboid family serine protease